jgi:hypothetical protein
LGGWISGKTSALQMENEAKFLFSLCRCGKLDNRGEMASFGLTIKVKGENEAIQKVRILQEKVNLMK